MSVMERIKSAERIDSYFMPMRAQGKASVKNSFSISTASSMIFLTVSG